MISVDVEDMKQIINSKDFIKVVGFAVRKYKLNYKKYFGTFENFAHEVAIHLFYYGKRKSKEGNTLKTSTIICLNTIWAFKKVKFKRKKIHKEVRLKTAHEPFVEIPLPKIDNILEIVLKCGELNEKEKTIFKIYFTVGELSYVKTGEVLGVTRQAIHQNIQKIYLKIEPLLR